VLDIRRQHKAQKKSGKNKTIGKEVNLWMAASKTMLL
jgi:hypothetical protein